MEVLGQHFQWPAFERCCAPTSSIESSQICIVSTISENQATSLVPSFKYPFEHVGFTLNELIFTVSGMAQERKDILILERHPSCWDSVKGKAGISWLKF